MKIRFNRRLGVILSEKYGTGTKSISLGNLIRAKLYQWGMSHDTLPFGWGWVKLPSAILKGMTIFAFGLGLYFPYHGLPNLCRVKSHATSKLMGFFYYDF